MPSLFCNAASQSSHTRFKKLRYRFRSILLKDCDLDLDLNNCHITIQFQLLLWIKGMLIVAVH